MVLLIFLALSSTYSLRSSCQGESHSYSIRGSSDTSLQKIMRDGVSTGENASKFLKVAWMTVPFGIVITVAACVLVFWWQELSYSNPYAQAILINGHAATHVSRIRVQSFALNLKIRRGEEEEVATYLVHRLDMPKKKLVRRSEDARKS